MMALAQRYTLAAIGMFVFAEPACADGTLALSEVLAAVSGAPQLVDEIKRELDSDGLKAGDVTCSAARHGNHWTYLGGGRVAPYQCKIGRHTLKIEADRIYFDRRGEPLGGLDEASPKRAKTFRESNFRWGWSP